MMVDENYGLESILDMTKLYLEQQSEITGGEFFLPERYLGLFKNLDKIPIQRLSELKQVALTCQKCELHRTRTHVVFGAGNERADLMLVGEAPGYEEDRQGLPFVGAAGQLLDKILHAIQFDRSQIYIANVIKCRPPQNRDPLPKEIEACSYYLKQQIAMIQPKIILALGRFAGQKLLKTDASLNQMRGKVHEIDGIKIMVTYHPAALLRHAEWKRPTWEDVKLLKKIYDAL